MSLHERRHDANEETIHTLDRFIPSVSTRNARRRLERWSSGVSCLRSTNRYPYGIAVASLNASCTNLPRPGYICRAKVVICDASRGFLNTTMYCEFRLMVRLSLFLGNRFCTRYSTDVFLWWLFLVNKVVTRL